ncbi:MAG: DUF4214 domain-containing protein [Acidimicrobiia bacterium]|nr:DUF4214 domain-containing protein [Acidimicrobiia bacterium]
MLEARRISVLVGAVLMVVAGFPATTMAAEAATPAEAAPTACVVDDGEANAIWASMTPTAPIEEDAAFNHDDEDAEDAPLALIRFPDETALWQSVGAVVTADVLAPGLDIDITPSRAFAFTGAERDDRAVSDSIVRLHCALFQREPDPFELEYWAGRYWNGLPLVTIAEAFTHSEEFVERHGIVSDPGLIDLLFTDVLGREAGVGTRGLIGRLASGEWHRGQAIVQFTESSEYVRRTGTAPPRKPPLPYPDVGSGRRIVVSDSGQRVWLIDDTGELAKTHQVSGRRGVPGVGRYRVYSMSRYAWAPYDGITMEFMVRFARGSTWPYGFHSIPIRPNERPLQTPAQLGTHRSGGCVRQLWDDAAAVFDWAEIGDRVIVIP